MIFPQKTLEWMIETSNTKKEYYLCYKLNQINEMTDYNKMNRWFGYYQYYGENKGLWSLNEIIEKVRAERNE